jgi:hypothetical protein
MRKHFEILRNCYDTRHLPGAQSVSCGSYVPFGTNLCAIPSRRCFVSKAGIADNLTAIVRPKRVDHSASEGLLRLRACQPRSPME